MIKKFFWEKYDNRSDVNTDTQPFPNMSGDEFDDENQQLHAHYKIIPLPFGFFGPKQQQYQYDDFDIWILHTNFNITHEICQLISVIPGVEAVTVLSRYRIKIGFHKTSSSTKIFNIKEIQKRIEQSILGFLIFKQDELINAFPEEISKKVKLLRDNIDSKYEHWAIYVLPNADIEIVTSNDYSCDFVKKVQFLCYMQKIINGVVIMSDDKVFFT